MDRDMNDNQPTEPTALPTPYPDLTPRQRMVVHICNGIGNDMQFGTTAEQHTAALLRLCADATSRGYAGELVAAMREWAWGHGK